MAPLFDCQRMRRGSLAFIKALPPDPSYDFQSFMPSGSRAVLFYDEERRQGVAGLHRAFVTKPEGKNAVR